MSSAKPADGGNPSLSTSFAWSLTGNMVYAASQVGVVAVLANLASPTTVGRYAFGLAIVTPVLLFAKLQLRSVLATDVRRDYSFSDYLGIRLLSTAIGCGSVFLVLAVANFERDAAVMIGIVTLAKVVESASDLLYGLMQRHGYWDRISIAMMIKGLGSLAALGILLTLGGSPAWGLLAAAAWQAVVLVVFELPSARRILRREHESGWPTCNPLAVLKLIRLSLPLGVVASLVSLNVNLPRYILEGWWGTQHLGYYAALANLATMGNILMQPLGQVTLSRMALLGRADPTAFRRLLTRILGLAALVGTAGVLASVLFGQRILAMVYQPGYAALNPVLTWLMAGSAITYVSSMLGYAMTARRLFRVQVPLYAMSVLVSLCLCLAYVPSRGLMGAAYATVGSWAAVAAASLAVLGWSHFQTRRWAVRRAAFDSQRGPEVSRATAKEGLLG